MDKPTDLDAIDALYKAAALSNTRVLSALTQVDGGADYAIVDPGNCVLIECFEIVGPNGFRQPASSRARWIHEMSTHWPALRDELRMHRTERRRMLDWYDKITDLLECGGESIVEAVQRVVDELRALRAVRDAADRHCRAMYSGNYADTDADRQASLADLRQADMDMWQTLRALHHRAKPRTINVHDLPKREQSIGVYDFRRGRDEEGCPLD